MSQKTRDAAQGYWLEILPHFGIDAKFLVDRHGPCPLCGGSDRFRWDDGRGVGDPGNGGYHCGQCGAGTGLKLVMGANHWPFDKAAAELDKFLGNTFKPDPARAKERKDKADAEEKKAAEKKAYFSKLWKESRPVVSGDPVWLYLTRRCGDVKGLLNDIRFHPALQHSVDGGTHPAMLAMMGWDGKKFSGIHRTYLTKDGHKANVSPVRMSYGEVGIVRLGPMLERLGIAEGLETAICASHRFGLPVWSGISANGMESWEPPQGVTSVLVCGDNDESWTGQASAYALAKRLRLRGLCVEVAIPETVGFDWADVELGMVS